MDHQKNLSLKSRKMTAWGLIMSRMLYGIEIWGPASTEKQLNQMQVLQNSVMRWICNAKRGTRTVELLNTTGMMSVRQLVAYRVIMSGLSALHNNMPKIMSQWRGEKPRRLQLTSRSYRYVFGKLLSRLPDNISAGDPQKNKLLIRDWVRKNIPWDKKWEGLESASSSSDSE